MGDLFEGHQPRECGEHRTVGPHRAWCFDCSEWCYPDSELACKGCRIPILEAEPPTVSVQATDLLIALRHLHAVPPADQAAIDRLREAAHGAAAQTREPDCEHCGDDPPACHTCPRCGRVSTRELDAYTRRFLEQAKLRRDAVAQTRDSR